jgi:lipoyl(octanoyl) transferase
MMMRTSLQNSKSQNNWEWKVQNTLVDYEVAQKWMEQRVQAIQQNKAPECVWFLEHPPLYTLGTSGRESDIFASAQLPTFRTGRGGQVTYHGPGQRIIYLMTNLKFRGQDIRWYMHELEEWIIQALTHFGVNGERRPGRVGIWVQKEAKDCKIAALGVRVQKWVTSHGVALNINPDLQPYQDIVPCGLRQYGVTSLANLGIKVSFKEVDHILKETFPFAPQHCFT